MSPIERIASIHWANLDRNPPRPAKRSAPPILSKVRGSESRAGAHRPRLLGTFVADARMVDSVRYWNDAAHPERIHLSIIRSMWTGWAGFVNRAEFDALRAHVGADKVAPAFPSVPVL